MSYEEYLNAGMILSDFEAREYVRILFEYYNMKKDAGALYNKEDKTPLNIISLYTNYIKRRELKIIYGDYKEKFITNESIVEPGVTEEERKGLGAVYDYISNFQEGKPVNILVETFKIHNLLYSFCPHPEVAGYLRQDNAYLYDTPYDVTPGSEVVKEFNKYASKNMQYILGDNIFDYILESIELAVDLIKLQPFNDGNKRTFRAILNLLLKQAGIPPIYIRKEERNVYKDELLKAICEKDYEGIKKFYLYKIADSIVSLDIYSHDNEKIYEDTKTKKKTK